MDTKSTEIGIGVSRGYLKELYNIRKKPAKVAAHVDCNGAMRKKLLSFMEQSGIINEFEYQIYSSQEFCEIQKAMAYTKNSLATDIDIRLFVFR